ncbi:MAG: phosphate ABC transporter permease PstA [Methanomassiliicoccales archaeon]|nr:phosphate ABC transporter permease PstA [Methanomassiliicoccales archaeon]
MNRRTKEKTYFLFFRFCGAIVVLALLVLLTYIILGGIRSVNIDFITQFPKQGMSEGGILPAIVGTFYLCTIVLAFSVPVGVLSAIYLVEYEKNSTVKKIWRIVVHNLAGVPSIVYGLLGLGLFVMALDFGFSLIAAGLTVGLLVLPIIIAAAREAILAVPESVREASLALGATKWQTIRHHVLPYAMSGILTGIILSLSRAAGETAPILMTGAAYFMRSLPDSIFSQFMALPFHLYAMATQSSDLIATRPIQYGTALVLLMLVIGMNLIAILLRKKYRQKYRW